MGSISDIIFERFYEKNEVDRTTKQDDVNQPKHYTYNRFGIECIDVIEAALTPEEFAGFCKGNILKYTWREKYKGGTKDLKKAGWYQDRIVKARDRNNAQ